MFGHDTVYQLITEAIRPDNQLGKGNHATVYSFADPEFSDFVLRVAMTRDGSDPIGHIKKTTCLSSPKRLLVDPNFGQALLVNNARSHDPFLGVHLKVPEKSIKQLRGQSTSLALMETLWKSQPDENSNPFIPLFHNICRTMKGEYAPDFNLGNIIFDKQSGALSLVDQLVFRLEYSDGFGNYSNSVQQAARVLRSAFCLPPPKDMDEASSKRYQELVEKTTSKLAEAKQQVLVNELNEIKPLAFKYIDSVKATMEMPRREALALLNQLKTYSAEQAL